MQAFYKKFTIEDKPGLLKLFGRVPPIIGRMSNKLVYNAIMYDALRSRNVVIFFASLDNSPVGYVIATRDWNCFKRMFILRHPFIGLVVLAKRLKEKLKTHAVPANDLNRTDLDTLPALWNGKQTYACDNRVKRIAKVIYIGIDPQVRSRGVGRGLLANLIRHFNQQGCAHIDAYINKDNLASINMFKKAGWTVIQNQNGFLAFLDLGKGGYK
jgi:ribosomal protein S18 acetylase RimI-like enzyme